MAYVVIEEGPDTGPSSLYAVLEYTLEEAMASISAFISSSMQNLSSSQASYISYENLIYTVSVSIHVRANEIELFG